MDRKHPEHHVPDNHVEDLKAADAKDVHRAVREEGEQELARPGSALFWSGLAAGIAINASLITEGALRLHLPDSQWRALIVALGYPVGFLLVVLGRMQFFTESTITAMLPLATRRSRWALQRTLRLWTIVLTANLLGTLIGSAVLMSGAIGHHDLPQSLIAISREIAQLSPGATLVNAIPAGFLIAIVAWVLPNARDQSAIVIFAITYVVGIAGFSHSIVGSSEAFVLMWSGDVGAPTAVFGLILPAVIGNLIGGAGIFALLAHGQIHGEGDRAG